MTGIDLDMILKGIDNLQKAHEDLLAVCKKAIDSNSIQILIDYLKNNGGNNS